MDKEFLWDHRNGYIEVDKTNRGVLAQRDGISKYNSTVINDSSTKVRKLFEARFNGGTNAVIARANDAWYRYSGSDFTSLDGSRGTDNKGDAVMFSNTLVMVDGGVPRKSDSSWTVSDVSADANMPQDATAVWVHNHRLWMNSSTNKHMVYGSKVDAFTGATDWTGGTDAIQLDMTAVLPFGDEVLGFRTIGDLMLVIFCKKHIVIYDAPTTASDVTIKQVINVGAVNMTPMAQLAKDWVYPTRSGLKNLISSQAYEKFSPKDLTSLIEPLYREYMDDDSDVGALTGTYYNKLDVLFMTFHPTAGNADTLVYSPKHQNVVSRWQFHANPYSWLETADGELYIGMDDGFVYKYDKTTATDDGTKVSYAITPASLGVDSLNVYKSPRLLEMLIEADGDVTVSVDYWFGLNDSSAPTTTKSVSINVSESLWDEAVWDVAEWDGSNRELIRMFGLYGRGRNVNITIRHDTAGTRIKIPYAILKTILLGEK
jgi:hypothetical protein